MQEDPPEQGLCTKLCFSSLTARRRHLRTLLAIVLGIWRFIQRRAYPIKEFVLNAYDRRITHYYPWKKRVPYTHVPAFKYGEY